MNLILKCIIPMKAIPKGRPRLSRNGHAFTPAKTRMFESGVRGHLRSFYRGAPLLGAVKLELDFKIRAPKKSKFNYCAGSDLDNLTKAISDAANDILYADDRQITALSATKEYHDRDEIHLSLWAVVHPHTPCTS